MNPIERQLTEDQLAKFKDELADPWRLIRAAQQGIDPIVSQGITRQLECLIAEFEEKLKENTQSAPVDRASQNNAERLPNSDAASSGADTPRGLR